jgi:guanylate kinase
MMKKARDESEAPYTSSLSPLLIVLSGPSGVGKDAVLTRMRATGHNLQFITTVTTRRKRAKEKNNVDYHFVSTERFQDMLAKSELLEWANVYGNWYGVPKQPIKQAIDKGQDTIVKVDIQGATTIKKILPQAVLIFLTPPTIEELIVRLKQRHTETPFDLALRTKTAEAEIKQLPLFDYVVINKQGKIDLAVSQIASIITAEKCRVTPREITL